MRPQPGTLRYLRHILNGQKHDLSGRRDSTNLAGSRETIHYGHVDVEKNDIRLQFDDFLDGLLAILGIPANLKRMPIQKRTNRRSRGKMVIDDEDSCRHPTRVASTRRVGI